MGPKSKHNNKNANHKKGQKDSYLADDKNFESFSAQLAKLGLELRDITGDGNCCFRALSDQINGDESLHLDIRRRVCEYMLRNRDEFEPFVAALLEDSDDDSSNKKSNKKQQQANKNMDAYEMYIKNLEKSGTYADNGVLVAFARLYNYDLNIHQLDLPIWTINSGSLSNKPVRQLHLSYHNGEHYSSIRPKGDRTNQPTNIIVKNTSDNPTKNSNKHNSAYASNTDYADYEDESQFYLNETEEAINNFHVEQIIDSTNCHDVNLILETLKNTNNDVAMTIETLLAKMQLEEEEEEKGDDNQNDLIQHKKSSSSKQQKIDKKKEKKMRQMERQRIKILEQREKESHDTSKKKEVKPNQIIEINNAAAESTSDDPQDFNILVNNIEKTSI